MVLLTKSLQRVGSILPELKQIYITRNLYCASKLYSKTRNIKTSNRMIELRNDRIPSDKLLCAINRKKTVYRVRKKVITSQQFMCAELNDGLIDDKS